MVFKRLQFSLGVMFRHIVALGPTHRGPGLGRLQQTDKYLSCMTFFMDPVILLWISQHVKRKPPINIMWYILRQISGTQHFPRGKSITVKREQPAIFFVSKDYIRSRYHAIG